MFFGRKKIQIVTAERFTPSFFRLRSVHGFTSRNTVGPDAHPPRIAQRRKLARNYPQRFLKNVLRGVGVTDDCQDVSVERTLQRAENAIQRFSVAGLRTCYEEQLIGALSQCALIDSRATSTRPTDREM